MAISAVVHGFDGAEAWATAAKLNAQVRQHGSSKTAFYSVSSHGLYGFAFADLGPSFTYSHTVKGDGEDKQLSKTITESQSLEDFLTNFADTSNKLCWKRRGR